MREGAFAAVAAFTLGMLEMELHRLGLHPVSIPGKLSMSFKAFIITVVIKQQCRTIFIVSRVQTFFLKEFP